MGNKKNICAISMFKDEEDIAYHSIVSMAEEGINTILVANNLSTDNTLNELNKAKEAVKDSCKVVIIEDDEVGYYQSKKMTSLANMAHYQYYADWIIPFDCDELWFSPQGKISDVINSLPNSFDIIRATLYNHFPTSLDPEGIVPFETIQWRQNVAGALPKVAFKWMEGCVVEQGNHGVQLPVTFPNSLVAYNLEVRHFPYRTWQQFKRKAMNGGAAYSATNLPENIGSHWRGYKQLIEKWGDEVVEWEVYRRYFYFVSPMDNNMIHDPAPFRRWNNLK